jgi:hypothetical protein
VLINEQYIESVLCSTDITIYHCITLKFIFSVVQKHLHILGIIVHKYPECIKPEERSLLLRIYLAQLEEQVNSYVLSYMFVLCQG